MLYSHRHTHKAQIYINRKSTKVKNSTVHKKSKYFFFVSKVHRQIGQHHDSKIKMSWCLEPEKDTE